MLCEVVDCEYPCLCGYYGDHEKECTCSMTMVSRYQKRISGPLLDRIDTQVEVPRVDYEKLSSDRLGEPSKAGARPGRSGARSATGAL
jgi:magnesium chelatase family protein